ncbi:hypothetical protein B0H19DRAFT_1188595 [Mycena capillaripes]|nr:hypothetical protein B0H19DRAFT_1188595 [Mycena capillaripes]
MSRRSSRLKDLVLVEDPATSNPSDDDDFHNVEEEEPEFIPKKKRRKVAKSTEPSTEDQKVDQKVKRVRGRRGILSSLREFPLDVVAEIFGHLNPMDLLNLARTTKEIRGILMTRSNAFIWKESRTRVEGLPDLPRDLCEPQYANLCFDSHCHKCLTTPVQTIIWAARTRHCKKCIQEDFDTGPNVLSEAHLESLLLELVPVYEDRRRGRRYWRTHTFYSLNAATKLSEECEEFRTDGTLQIRDARYVEWYKQKFDEMKEIKTHAVLCTTWAANRTTNRRDELDDARRLRRDAIVERLTALGWGEEIPFLTDEFDSHKLVRQPKELTDRIWKNIEAPLVELLKDLKKKRLEAARVKIIRERRQLAAQVYSKFRETFPADTVFPPMVDMIRTEPFREVIENTSIYPEEKVTEESFAAALLQVPEFSMEWKRSKDNELVEIMKKTLSDSVEADLHLASTFFKCSRPSSEPINYPRILVHSSTTTFRWSRDDSDHTLQDALKEEAWNDAAGVQYDERASRSVRSVVEACGLDPDVTTASEMDEINPVMECLNCSDDTHGRLAMRWIQTAYHSCLSNKPSWKCLEVDEEAFVEARESETLTSSISLMQVGYQGWLDIYCCKYCDNIGKTSFNKLKAHLETAHNINTISLQDLKYHADASIGSRHPRPIRLKPPVVPEVEMQEPAVQETTNKEVTDQDAGLGSESVATA